VLIAIPLYGLVTWLMTRRLATQLDEYYGLWDEVSARIQQGVAVIKTLLGLGAVEREVASVGQAADRAFQAYLQRGRLENRYVFLQEGIIAASRAAAMLLAGLKALEHQLTPGDIVLLVAYLDRVFDPIESLTGLYASLQEHATAAQRARRLLDTAVAPGHDLPPYRPGPGRIEFRDVYWAYRPERPVLAGITFSIEAGEHVALVGPSGAGKTTLTDLLVGFYQPQRGSILLDGQDVGSVSPQSLRVHVRGVAADGALMRTSIAENIRYGRFEANADDVLEAARLAGLEPLLTRHPDGLETQVGERGVEVSMGERQRILLARAFVAQPTVLLLDEATANLDFRTEETVKEALRRLSSGRTTLLIAHRRSMLTDVDRVLVLRGGRIEQDGPPAALLDEPGYFRDMMTAESERRRG
jgi:ABC-type multidrug transport system fused ATPase/permease subunit